jgi:hypothetical protein
MYKAKQKIQNSYQANAPKTPQKMDNRVTTERTQACNKIYFSFFAG